MHFSGSFALCETGTPYETPSGPDETISSLSLVKEMLEALHVGLRKEYADAGVGSGPMTDAMAGVLEALAKVNRLRVAAGLSDERHETDLLADVAGCGLWLCVRALGLLAWHSEGPE
jgi:hypothetical protein